MTDKPLIVLSPGRCGSNAVARRLALGFPGRRVLHMHTFDLDRGHLLPKNDEGFPYEPGADSPDHDAVQRDVSERIRHGEPGWEILIMLREPLSRAVSAWRAFHEGAGDFWSDYDHGAATAWWFRQVARYVLDGSATMARVGPGVFALSPTPNRVWALRYEDMLDGLQYAAEAVTGEPLGPGEWELLNPSPKGPVPVVSEKTARFLQDMAWERPFYTDEEMRAARERWCS